MSRWGIGVIAAVVLLFPPHANAEPGDGGGIGGPGGPGGPGGIGPNFAPAGASLFMCPGRGGAADVLGLGGGYCDFNFTPVELEPGKFGVMHIHCEWGGARFLLQMWNCWRVFPGQPDHPALPDPDIIPDGMGVPWAITGPAPWDQWPPPGLQDGNALLNAPPIDHLPGPPPGPLP